MRIVLPPCPDVACTAKRLIVSGDRAICVGVLKRQLGTEKYSLCLFSGADRLRIMLNDADKQAIVSLLESL